MTRNIFNSTIITISLTGTFLSNVMLLISHFILNRPIDSVLPIIVIVGLSTLFSGLFACLIIRRITIPLNKLIEKAEKIKNTGVNGIKLKKYYFDEFRILDESLDQIVISLTERLKIEDDLKNMEATLRQTQKLSSLGELAAGVAHEINNPISGIINYADLVRDSHAKGTDDYISLTQIIEQGHRIGKIANDLLSFARDKSDELVLTDIKDTIEGSLSLMGNSITKQGVTLEINYKGEIPFINSNKNKLIQIFINLITNSVFALNKKYPGDHINKRICIDVYIDGGFMIIEFKDYGIGIPQDKLDIIFDPFFTTKRTQGGTGLGLSVSYGIIKNHGGHIIVDSIEGEFTKFTIKLPIETK